MKKNIVYIIISLTILLTLSFVYYLSNKTNKNNLNLVNNNINILFSKNEVDSIQKKISSLKLLKDISLDTRNSKEVRGLAGEAVIYNFFKNGNILQDGFSDASSFNEKLIYDYAKNINDLNPESRYTSLLYTYIGLRFFKEDINKEKIINSINSHKNYLSKNKIIEDCDGYKKIASIVYMSEKNNMSVSDMYGSYNTLFEEAFNYCHEKAKPVTAFLWLGALIDTGDYKKEQYSDMSSKLFDYITSTTTPDNLIQQLKKSYFVNNPEPDTVSIVNNIKIAYPDFSKYLENIKK